MGVAGLLVGFALRLAFQPAMLKAAKQQQANKDTIRATDHFLLFKKSIVKLIFRAIYDGEGRGGEMAAIRSRLSHKKQHLEKVL